MLENEFGDVPVDDSLVVSKLESDDLIYTVSNGCICCSAQGDVVEGLMRLCSLNQGAAPQVDYIVVEATGIADPGEVCEAILRAPELRGLIRLDGVVTVVDAHNVVRHLRLASALTDPSAAAEAAAQLSGGGKGGHELEQRLDMADNVTRQIAFADRILVNKVDLASSATVELVKAHVRSINPMAKSFSLSLLSGAPPLTELIDVRAFDMGRMANALQAMGGEHSPGSESKEHHDRRDGHGATKGHEHSGHAERHEHLPTEGHGTEHSRRGPIISAHDHAAGTDHHEHVHHADDHEHAHHIRHAIQTQTIQVADLLSLPRLKSVLQSIALHYGDQLFRYKGIVKLKGLSQVMIIQGVHSTVETSLQSLAGPLPAVSTFVFIGDELPMEDFKALIHDTRAETEPRFKPGDEVLCKTLRGRYDEATVVSTWTDGYPYMVRTVFGSTLLVPVDDGGAITARPVPQQSGSGSASDVAGEVLAHEASPAKIRRLERDIGNALTE